MGPVRVVVVGGTGVVGRPLVERLCRRGHAVSAFTRNPAAARMQADARIIGWTPEDSTGWVQELEGCDVVVHLARSPLPLRWTPDARACLRNARLGMVRRLVQALAATAARPGAFICASSHDYYGSCPRGTRTTEAASAGHDFLARLYAEIEAEAACAASLGVRVVSARIGMVLGPGAVNPKWIPHVVADPDGALSWIHLDDATEILYLLTTSRAIRGPVNVTAPEPSTASELWRQIQRALGRASDRAPPGSGLSEDHVTFQPHWAYPAVMDRLGYRWRVTEIAEALAHLSAG